MSAHAALNNLADALTKPSPPPFLARRGYPQNDKQGGGCPLALQVYRRPNWPSCLSRVDADGHGGRSSRSIVAIVVAAAADDDDDDDVDMVMMMMMMMMMT
jgi:hypothetical protein